ncbi:MAPEG family protein [Pollutimonas harenae]|uniref:MAPEG family protein n=1 Tax=Pollutimonas harenae TaxID=657015 RepID=A0A853H6A1_9BURK|nr:MAPEG family protein [Pollutimonas harenae]NYT85634.1 MAPEG family protein [Pollutimonas harenae]TEA70711.1 MAPEG family protein [Pollutimonas harenae]
MSTIAWLLLIAALLPIIAAAASKAGGKAYNNNDPRLWLARQQGWRARANSAQENLFEGLPFFYVAVLFALYSQAEQGWLASMMMTWLALRMAYLAMYIAGYGTMRSIVWGLAFAVNVIILLFSLPGSA